jgi:hypothetical protein
MWPRFEQRKAEDGGSRDAEGAGAAEEFGAVELLAVVVHVRSL